MSILATGGVGWSADLPLFRALACPDMADMSPVSAASYLMSYWGGTSRFVR